MCPVNTGKYKDFAKNIFHFFSESGTFPRKKNFELSEAVKKSFDKFSVIEAQRIKVTRWLQSANKRKTPGLAFQHQQ